MFLNIWAIHRHVVFEIYTVYITALPVDIQLRNRKNLNAINWLHVIIVPKGNIHTDRLDGCSLNNDMKIN